MMVGGFRGGLRGIFFGGRGGWVLKGWEVKDFLGFCWGMGCFGFVFFGLDIGFWLKLG